jgi:hypothetical protein
MLKESRLWRDRTPAGAVDNDSVRRAYRAHSLLGGARPDGAFVGGPLR